jgi:hypothetical protein
VGLFVKVEYMIRIIPGPRSMRRDHWIIREYDDYQEAVAYARARILHRDSEAGHRNPMWDQAKITLHRRIIPDWEEVDIPWVE